MPKNNSESALYPKIPFEKKFREGHDYNRHGKRRAIAPPDNVSTHETNPG